MKRRFSAQQLFALRNQIPIDILIQDVLAMPTERSDGYFRFSCPLCDRFHTTVYFKDNLARCFDCQKNFNPIDMVMYRQKISFVQSVDFLNQLAIKKPQLKSEPRCAHHRQAPTSPPTSHRGSSRLSTAGANHNTAHRIGQILSEVMTADPPQSWPQQNIADYRNLLRRIEILEQKVAMLIQLSSPK